VPCLLSSFCAAVKSFTRREKPPTRRESPMPVINAVAFIDEAGEKGFVRNSASAIQRVPPSALTQPPILMQVSVPGTLTKPAP
jgi:hypothetical protein